CGKAEKSPPPQPLALVPAAPFLRSLRTRRTAFFGKKITCQKQTNHCNIPPKNGLQNILKSEVQTRLIYLLLLQIKQFPFPAYRQRQPVEECHSVCIAQHYAAAFPLDEEHQRFIEKQSVFDKAGNFARHTLPVAFQTLHVISLVTICHHNQRRKYY